MAYYFCDSYKSGSRLAPKNDISIIFSSLVKHALTSLRGFFKRLLPVYNDLIIMAY
jgi:hypothetical protein